MAGRSNEYRRVTERFAGSELPESGREFVRAAAARYGFEPDPLAGGAEGIRTTSTPTGGGFLRRRRPVVVHIALIARELLVVLSGALGAPLTVSLLRLSRLEVEEIDQPLGPGLELTGPALATTGDSSLVLPLDLGEVGETFRRKLRWAIATA